MSRPIVLVIRASSAHALVLDRRGNVKRESTAAIADGGDLVAELGSLLGEAKRRPRQMVVLVGASRSQLRTIAGLPKLDDTGALSRIVSEAPRRFFALAGPAVTTDVYRDAAGLHWCAAVDRALIDALAATARRASMRLVAVIPILALVNGHARAGGVTHVDGGVECVAHLANGRLESICRRRAVAGASEERAAEQRAMDLAAARGASVRVPLAWRPPPTGALGGHARRVGALAAGVVLLGITAGLAETVGAIRAGAAAARQLATLGDVPRRLAASTAELQRTTIAIDQVERFATARRSMSTLLRDLATALPESTAITTLRVDSLGVTITAVAPHVADVVPALTGVSGAVMPQLTGAATREVMGGARLERATLRFRFQRGGARRPTPARGTARRNP
jgi:Tfp pilus assembly protein PilN